MDPITMMVASIGMQFFNNYANSKKNTEIQEKQREFQKAAAEHDFERMRKLQAESAKLALELEAEVHKERVEDINSNYDSLLENFAHSFTIQNWPLNVLPFIMKGESFGSLFNGTAQSINLHCIFTPSNCDWFNEMFYDDIDLRLEAEMNNHWNAQSTHPIVYYGGGWNRRSLKYGVSQPNLIDLDDIGFLETHLKNIPVLVVTPYFDPWLHFRVKLWGMGKDCELPFRIDIPHGNIEKQKRIFSYDYNKETKVEMTDDFLNNTIEELVPYLESLIGFVADKYFWGVYHILPVLHKINKVTSMNSLIDTNNANNLKEYPNCAQFNVGTSINYLHSIKNTTTPKLYTDLENQQIRAIEKNANVGVSEINVLSDYGKTSTLSEKIEQMVKNFCIKKEERIEVIEEVDTSYESLCNLVSSLKKDALRPIYFVFCVWNSDILIGTFCSNDYSECIYEKCNTVVYFAILNKTLKCGIGDRTMKDFYSIDLSSDYLLRKIEMKNSDKQQLSLRERVARKLVENGYRLMGRNMSDEENCSPSDPWGDEKQTSNKIDELKSILAFFVNGVDNGKIPFKKMGTGMSMKNVLEWLDAIDENDIENKNQVYVVRGKYVAKNKLVYCAFLAKDDKFTLSDTPKICFICDADTEEMKDLYNGKSVYVIPFED